MNTVLQLPPPDGFGNRLRRARMLRGLSCAEMGEKVTTHRSSVSRWETGKVAPTMRTLRELSEALGILQPWLAYGEGPMEALAKNQVIQAEGN